MYSFFVCDEEFDSVNSRFELQSVVGHRNLTPVLPVRALPARS